MKISIGGRRFSEKTEGKGQKKEVSKELFISFQKNHITLYSVIMKRTVHNFVKYCVGKLLGTQIFTELTVAPTVLRYL